MKIEIEIINNDEDQWGYKYGVIATIPAEKLRDYYVAEGDAEPDDEIDSAWDGIIIERGLYNQLLDVVAVIQVSSDEEDREFHDGMDLTGASRPEDVLTYLQQYIDRDRNMLARLRERLETFTPDWRRLSHTEDVSSRASRILSPRDDPPSDT